MDPRFEEEAPATQYYDNALFERLRRDYGRNSLSTPLLTDIRYATRADIQSHWPDEAHRKTGSSTISAGDVGAVILCGGLATRFGGGAKAAVELLPGWTLLRVKLKALAGVAAAHDTTLAVIVVVSPATELAVLKVLESQSHARLRIKVVTQSVLPRLLEDGHLLLQADGTPSFSPPGHGEVPKLLAAHHSIDGISPRLWQISNIDNLLATLDADIVGAHIASKMDATVEVAPGTATDVGGYLTYGPHGFEILEGFQVDPSDRPTQEFFLNTNTFLIGGTAISAGERLPYYAVTKTTSDRRTAVQFEQLLGGIGRLISLNAVAVPRDGNMSRFRPMKLIEDLHESRSAVVAALEASGLINW